MNSISLKKMSRLQYQIRIFKQSAVLCIVLGIILVHCKANALPPGIPSKAKFERKKNLYTFSDEKYNYIYYPNGSLYEKCEHNELSKLDGRCEAYLLNSKQIISYGNFKNGQRDGIWTWTFPNGKPYVIQNFTYGKKKEFWLPIEIWGNEDGLYKRFYPNGNLEEEGSFDTGEKTGSWKKYYIDGSLEYSGSYRKSKKILNWKYFYPNMKLEAQELYDNNGELKSRKTYYPNGNLWCSMDSSNIVDCK